MPPCHGRRQSRARRPQNGLGRPNLAVRHGVDVAGKPIHILSRALRRLEKKIQRQAAARLRMRSPRSNRIALQSVSRCPNRRSGRARRIAPGTRPSDFCAIQDGLVVPSPQSRPRARRKPVRGLGFADLPPARYAPPSSRRPANSTGETHESILGLVASVQHRSRC